MNISNQQVLRDLHGRAVPQYYDYATNTFKPMSIEDVSHINVNQTQAQFGRRSTEYIVYPNQYLGADGVWYVYNPLTFVAEHDDNIDLSLLVKSVNGVLPDADGNVQLICEHPEMVKSVDGAFPDANGNVSIQYPIVDLSEYALLSELDDYVQNADLADYATLDDLESFATTSQLDAYALLSDIPQPQDISHLATQQDLAQLEFDLSEYMEDFATLSDFSELLPEFNDFATKAEMYVELNNYVNHDEANAFARLVELEDYALKTEIPKLPRFYSAIATVTESGNWSIDYSEEGFSKIISVTPTPIASVETAASMPITSNLTSINLNGASGIAYKSSSAGLLAAMQQIRADAGTQIQVLVIAE